jgi:hypothetical protein
MLPDKEASSKRRDTVATTNPSSWLHIVGGYEKGIRILTNKVKTLTNTTQNSHEKNEIFHEHILANMPSKDMSWTNQECILSA